MVVYPIYVVGKVFVILYYYLLELYRKARVIIPLQLLGVRLFSPVLSSFRSAVGSRLAGLDISLRSLVYK